jgi:hypothetical protein
VLHGKPNVVHVILKWLARVQELKFLFGASSVGIVVQLAQNVLDIQDFALVEHDLLLGIFKVVLFVVRDVAHYSKASLQSAEETRSISRVVVGILIASELSDAVKLLHTCGIAKVALGSILGVDIPQVLCKVAAGVLQRKWEVVVRLGRLEVLQFAASSISNFRCGTRWLLLPRLRIARPRTIDFLL